MMKASPPPKEQDDDDDNHPVKSMLFQNISVVIPLVCESFIKSKKCNFKNLLDVFQKKKNFDLLNTTHTWTIFRTSKSNVNLSAIMENMSNCFSGKYR